MTRKHSTRLSQEHDEDPEDGGQHTAARDYPELGTILDDRPDPGRQITVIGSKTAAAYGTEDDARNSDYNGGEGDLGMDWAEPASQDWVHENIGPQEEAPPPPWAMSPVMARLAELEEAAGFFGREAARPDPWAELRNHMVEDHGTTDPYARHANPYELEDHHRWIHDQGYQDHGHDEDPDWEAEAGGAHDFYASRRRATTINGTQVDDAGDAPQHGTIPRAEDPDSYDDRSQEGEGDDKWNEPLPWGDKKNENAATVGMYPEGISSGNGPGISVGPFTADLRGWEQRPDLTILHGTWITREGLADHLRAFHGMDFDPGRRSASEMRGVHTWHHMTHPDYEGGSHPLHWSPEFDDDDDEENSAPQYGRLQAPGEDEPDYDTAAHYRAHEGPIDAVFGSLHEARVPWTGEERGRLHRWQEEPTATWGDFVNSAEFMDSPAERSNVRHNEDGEGIGVVEATSDRQWEAHLRRDHGWGDANFENVRKRGDRFSDMHEALHSAGLANHKHQGGPEQAEDEARERSLTNMFGIDPGFNRNMRALIQDRSGGAMRSNHEHRLDMSEPAVMPRHPDEWAQVDPARFRRMMSALDAPHAHDDDFSPLDAGAVEGDEGFPGPHEDGQSPWRTAASASVRSDLIRQLKDDYPPEALEWIRHASVTGPHLVPLDAVDWSGRGTWTSYKQPRRCGAFMETLDKKASQGKHLKPVLIVAAGDKQPFIADGHHRSIVQLLAAAQGQGRPGIWAYTARVKDAEGPWDDMHDRQLRATSRDSTKRVSGPDAPPREVKAFQRRVDSAVASLKLDASRTAAFNVHVRIDGKELASQEHDDEDNSLDYDKDKTPDKEPDRNGPETGSSQLDDADSLDSPADIPAAVKPSGKSGNPAADAQGFPPGHPMSDPANWPQAGADVNERERAYTQGSDDGKVKRGAPAPASFSPDDADSGGGGDQGDDEENTPFDTDGESDSSPISKDAALGMFTAAAGNPEFRFEFTASWHDVMAKAKRIRAEGHVRITHASAGMVIGEVRGDHDIYESGIQRPVGKRSAIQHWACGCPWASYHQDKSYGGRYAGRPCSHVMALQFEAQSRGMFGRPFDADGEPAAWSPPTVVVKSMPPYEGEPHRGRWREQWRAPLAHLAHIEGSPYVPPLEPGDLAQHIIHHHGINPDSVARGLEAGGDDWARRWHDSEHRYRTSHPVDHQHETPIGTPGETRWPDVFEPEHGFRLDEYGGTPLRQDIPETDPFEPMPPHWSSLGAPSERATAALARAGADPDEIGALRLLAGLRATADQANAPWGSNNVSEHPPQKPYGATSPPNKDQDPGSYGPLSAPDPENWGGIDDGSVYQMPLTNTAAHQVLVPGAPRPVPGDTDWPGTAGWQAEDQGTFGFTDRANTAGPSTAMNPRDPQGIRMEESRYDTRWFVPRYGEDHYSGAVAHGMRNAAEHNRDYMVVPFWQRDSGAPKIAVTSDYSFGNNRGHFRVSPEGTWHRYNPDTGYDRWHGAPQPHEVHAQSELNRMRDEVPASYAPEEPGYHWGSDEAEYHGHEGPIDPVFGALASGTPYPFRDTVPQLDGALAELHDHPEPALPSTTGDEEIEATAAADGTIGGGSAGTGEGVGAPLNTAALGEFGASVRESFRRMFGGTAMGDQGIAEGLSGGGQEPSPVGQNPGMGSSDEYLTPDDQSIQTIGNQQWSGGGADSDEVAVPAGQPQGGIDDIVAAFQRSAASKAYAGGSAPGPADGDIAVAARRYLEKTADVLPRAEADELIREGRGERARNLNLLHLEGTHYEEEDSDLARKGISMDDYDDDVISA